MIKFLGKILLVVLTLSVVFDYHAEILAFTKDVFGGALNVFFGGTFSLAHILGRWERYLVHDIQPVLWLLVVGIILIITKWGPDLGWQLIGVVLIVSLFPILLPFAMIVIAFMATSKVSGQIGCVATIAIVTLLSAMSYAGYTLYFM